MAGARPEAGVHEAAAPPFPPLVGHRVALRPVDISDYPALRSMEFDNELGVHWKYRGQILSPEQWAQKLWSNVLAQFVVISRDSGTPIGLVAAYRASFQDGHAYVEALGFRPKARSPTMLFGTAVFLQYVFGCWGFRKIYMETTSYNLRQFASGLDRYFEVEGRLRDHYVYAGQTWDQLTLAIYRETWEKESRRLLMAAGVLPRPKVTVRMPRNAAAGR